MIIEDEICERVKARLIAAIPELEGRVLLEPRFPTDIRYWPCVIVDIPRVNYVVEGNRVGSRPMKGLAAMNIAISDNGDREGILKAMRLLGNQIHRALMSEPYLEDENGKALISDLTLAWSASDIVRQSGVKIAVRQVTYSLVFRTREDLDTSTTR